MRVRVASAGTGKTTSLVFRLLELVGAGTPLRRLAGVTFTRVAASELRARVGEGLDALLAEGRFLTLELRALGPAAEARLEEAALELAGASLSTIHGFMGELLRLCAPGLGLDPDFTVIGDWEAQAIFEEELASLRYLARDPAHPSHARSAALSDDAPLIMLFKKRSLALRYRPAAGERNAQLVALFDELMARYRARLGAALLTPSELERRTATLTQNPALLARLRGRYTRVLVDEFQDVNPLQGAFFEALERGGVALEVVGDPKQSIYAFRHADVAVFRRALDRGEQQAPLTTSRRHAGVILRFLNRMTDSFAARGWGFHPNEAPTITAAGAQAGVLGRLECHWLVDEARLDHLREREAEVLAARLLELSERYAPSDMAVLARSYGGLAVIEPALQRAGLPYVLVQGRGYFERLEVRDLYHALRVGAFPHGLSLASWLRSPFGGLELAAIDRLLGASEPLAALERDHPEVHARLLRIQSAVRELSPTEALKELIRAPLIGGRRYVDMLDARARENVDALLFTVAGAPAGELELLLARLELLSRQAEAGDVPQSGEGIRLMTVHRAKGLEWPVVAIFDAGRGTPLQRETLYVEPQTGRVALDNTPDYAALQSESRAREHHESYRLLYVAASRARDVLLITGSVRGQARGWAEALDALGVGPSAQPWDRAELQVKRWPFAPPAPASSPAAQASSEAAPAWIDRRFARSPLPPVFSPSALTSEDEPLPFSDPEEGARLPGRARAIGTLVHYAISQDWSAKNPAHLANLEAQEVMFPFAAPERQEVMRDVAALLAGYERLLGDALAWPRDEDFPELPMALPRGSTVWQGIIDRLYRVGERWFLDDYKTDLVIEPERYHVQLGLYLLAVREVLGAEPELRLVYLRHGELIRLEAKTVLAAVDEALSGAALLQALPADA